MFSLPLRMGLIGGCVALGILTLEYRWLAVMWFVSAGLIVAGYFRYGTVVLAFRAKIAGRMERARRLLDQILWPGLLGSQARAYYEWLRGQLAWEAERWEEARQRFEAALARKLRTENDRCLAEGCLAAALAKCGDRAAAEATLKQARGRNPKPEVAELLAEVERGWSSLG